MTQISSHNEDRFRRANSWIEQSKKVKSDDEKFIFLWIAFNAAYGDEYNQGLKKERDKFEDFLEKILRGNGKKTIEEILFKKIPSKMIDDMIKNKYGYERYWESVRGKLDKVTWTKEFKDKKEEVRRAYKNNNAKLVLREVLNRLYTLRNQIFHGGTTFADGWGRERLEDGRKIMAQLVPEILAIMKANPKSDVWGKVAYPRHRDESWAVRS